MPTRTVCQCRMLILNVNLGLYKDASFVSKSLAICTWYSSSLLTLIVVLYFKNSRNKVLLEPEHFVAREKRTEMR
jgi:hypothetical protein